MDRTMIRRFVTMIASGGARAIAGTHWAAMSPLRSRLASAIVSLALITTFTIAFAQVAFAASLALGTTSGLAGSTVSVSGQGFGPNTSVSLFFAGIPLGTGSSDSNGALSMAFTVPEVPGSTYPVFATSLSGDFLAVAFFTIPGPGFTLTPTKGVAGTIVTVVTGGVTPNSVVLLDFAGIPEGTVASDSGGIVNATFTVPAQPPGDYPVEATTAGGAFFAFAVFTLLPPDTTPPSITCAATPSQLWPPDHRLVLVSVTVIVTDSGSGPAGFTLDSVTSSEPDAGVGDGDQPIDIQGFTVGTADVTGQLRAERSGMGSGRVYTLTYTGRDLAGNTADCFLKVIVPHNLG